MDYMIPLQGKDVVSKASVPAGKASTVDLGIIDVSMKIGKPTGDTSKSTPAMPKYKTIPGRKQGTKLSKPIKTVNVGESSMKQSFKQFLAESADAAVFKMAADFLDTTPDNLEPVAKSIEDKVLDTGKELKHDFVKAALGKWVIRLFSALGRKFARVEAPTGKMATYQATKVEEAFIAPPSPYGTQYPNPYTGQVEFASSELIDGPVTYKDLKAKVKSLVGDKHFELGTGDSYKTTLMSSKDMKANEIIKLLKLKKAKVVK